MGSYIFKWEHPAETVFVTGSFDNWSGHLHKLDKSGTVHQKTVDLPSTTDKILYKFVADGTWQHDHTAQTETDHEGNVNNVLYPRDITPKSLVSQFLSSLGPTATSSEMGEFENTPGAFPETPAADQDKSFSVNPIPASAGAGNPIQLAPGEKVPDPSTINNNSITSTVRDDPSLKSSAQDTEQTFGISPIPATGGIGNPVQLQPGEKVPDASTLTASTLTSNVKLDQSSYESAPQLPPVLSPQSEREAEGAAIFTGLGPQTTNMIPESSMGMGKDVPPPIDAGPLMSSVGTASTTNQLAGQQPLEPRGVAAISSVGTTSTTSQLAGQQPLEVRGVPEVVQDSQKEAHVAPEASANATAVSEKKEVENELLSKVSQEPAVSQAPTTSQEPAASQNGIFGAVAGGVAAAGAAVAGALAYANEKTKETTGQDPALSMPQSVQDSINANKPATAPAVGDAAYQTASAVPREVTSSQKEARVSPEAAANPVAVTEKTEVEKELLNKIPTSQETGEPAPVAAASTSATAPAATPSTAPIAVSAMPITTSSTSGTATTASGAPQLADPVGAGLAPISMDEGSKELNAPAGSQAQTPGTKVGALAARAGADSRDVSPMTKLSTTGQTEPVVTTGVGSATAPTESKPIGTPRNQTASASSAGKRNSFMERMKGTPESQKSTPGSSDGKKKGFFTKLKEKMKQ